MLNAECGVWNPEPHDRRKFPLRLDRGPRSAKRIPDLGHPSCGGLGKPLGQGEVSIPFRPWTFDFGLKTLDSGLSVRRVSCRFSVGRRRSRPCLPPVRTIRKEAAGDFRRSGYISQFITVRVWSSEGWGAIQPDRSAVAPPFQPRLSVSAPSPPPPGTTLRVADFWIGESILWRAWEATESGVRCRFSVADHKTFDANFAN